MTPLPHVPSEKAPSWLGMMTLKNMTRTGELDETVLRRVACY